MSVATSNANPHPLQSQLQQPPDCNATVNRKGRPAGPPLLQVIFCSRTHSQLTQFVAELRRTPFGDSMAVVALASRKVLVQVESGSNLPASALCMKGEGASSAACDMHVTCYRDCRRVVASLESHITCIAMSACVASEPQAEP